MKSFLPLLLSAILFSSIANATKREVLFIGNSYTAGMTQVLQQLAQNLGDTLVVTEISPGGYTLQAHSTDMTTLNAIKQAKWDIVVLQEQSQRPSFSPTQVASDVYPYAKTLDGLIKQNHACTETMFYMTWGRKNGDAANCQFYPPICTYAGMQQRLRESYIEMAKDNNGVVAPVGATWKMLRDSVASIDLYQPDESHPSAAGTYLTACVFYASIFHKSPEGSTYYGGLSANDAQKIQYYTKKVTLDSLNHWQQHGDYTYANFIHTIGANNTVTFQNTSIKATNNAWAFGDGNNSTQTSPTHMYATKSKFAVTLTASNSCFSERKTDTVTLGTVNINQIHTEHSSIKIANVKAGIIQIIAPDYIGSTLSIFTIDGRKVIEKIMSKKEETIQLEPNIYIYSISQNGKLIQQGKLSSL